MVLRRPCKMAGGARESDMDEEMVEWREKRREGFRHSRPRRGQVGKLK